LSDWLKEAWRARLPLAFKLQLHAREKLGEEASGDGLVG
jgi:hypothetical protein